MAHSSPAVDNAPAPDCSGLAPAPAWPGVVLQGTVIVIAAAALACLLALLVDRHSAPGVWALQVLLAAATLLAAGWQAAQRHLLWSRALRPLQALVRRVQDGELPIESLSQLSGPTAAVVPLIQDLLRDLRRQRAERAALEQEIGQRVAQRTDALERLLGSVKQKATKDPLTGLSNRRAMDEHLPPLVERRRADRGALCLLMIDVDHFKHLNDTLGHAAGDDLLRSIGQLVRSSIRESDLAFRCGGDEFVVVLDGCDAAAARRMADRLVSLVDALAKPLKVTRPPRLAIGVSALCDLRDPTPDALLERADRMLYEVKRARKRSA